MVYECYHLDNERLLLIDRDVLYLYPYIGIEVDGKPAVIEERCVFAWHNEPACTTTRVLKINDMEVPLDGKSFSMNGTHKITLHGQLLYERNGIVTVYDKIHVPLFPYLIHTST